MLGSFRRNCLLATRFRKHGFRLRAPQPIERLKPSSEPTMQRRPKFPHFQNVVFLDRIGDTLRQATSDIAREDLPENIRLLLRRLDRLDMRDQRRKAQKQIGET